MYAMLPTETASAGFSVNPVLSIVLAIAFAVACYFLAVRKGRRGVLWAVLGFFFSLISLIVLAILPSKAGAGTKV